MRTRLVLTTGLAAATLLALAGCFGTPGATGGDTGGTDGSGSSGSESGPVGIAGCLQGSWDLDEDAAVRDLAEYLSGNGANVVSAETSGGVNLVVEGDAMTYLSDVTYTITVDMGGGLTMVINQLQTGESSGTWTAEGDTVVFSDWAQGIEIVNDITINGQTSSATFDLPSEEMGLPMEVTCDGDLMSTQPEGSPFMSVWSRE